MTTARARLGGPRVLAAVLACLAVLVGGGCTTAPAPIAAPAASAAPPTPTGALESVSIIHVPSVLFAPLYVGIEKGYFRDQGVDVRLDVAAAGQDAMPLLANGQLDVLVGGFSAATFNAIGRGLQLSVVASMGRQPQQGYPSALMVRQDLLDSGAVKSMADLKGRKVALSGGLGATGSYWMATKLRPANLTLQDIQLVNMGFPDMVAALQSRAIDAAYPSSPVTSTIKSQGTADYFGGVTAPGASAVGVVFGGAFIKERPRVAQNVMLALVRAARDIQGQAYFAPENLLAYSKYTSTPVDTLKGMDPYAFDPDLKPDVDTLLDMQQVFLAEGAITSNPLTPDQLVNQSFQQNAVQQLGPAR